MDKLTKSQRSKNMRAIKSSGSKIEIMFGKAMWAKGLRYRKNDKSVYGKPDFTFKKYKVAVFCDSEFWHGKNWAKKKNEHKSNVDFWHKKIERNIMRDNEVNSYLTKNGWHVLRFWGKKIEKELESCVTIVQNTVKKLEKDRQGNEVKEKAAQYQLFDFAKDIPFPKPENSTFKFIDLFAGIGGFRIALQNLGGECVYTSEWDEQAKKTYEANFGDVPFGDITKPETKKFIPDGFDVLCAGFPCQAFSIAGKRGGFEDTRGTLFFDVAEIIKDKKPKAIFLENVKGLISHHRGKTLATILNVLRNELGYYVPEPQIINAKNFGVPQNRERIFIVGFRKDLNITDFKYPCPLDENKTFEDIKEESTVSVKYYLSDTYLNTLIAHKERHAKKGNGFGYEIIQDDGIANAVVCGGMGRERNLVIDHRLEDFTPVTNIKGPVNRKGIRKMTPREWARLQGFPDKFVIPVADASAYKQFGNSVAVPAIQATAQNLIELICEEK